MTLVGAPALRLRALAGQAGAAGAVAVARHRTGTGGRRRRGMRDESPAGAPTAAVSECGWGPNRAAICPSSSGRLLGLRSRRRRARPPFVFDWCVLTARPLLVWPLLVAADFAPVLRPKRGRHHTPHRQTNTRKRTSGRGQEGRHLEGGWRCGCAWVAWLLGGRWQERARPARCFRGARLTRLGCSTSSRDTLHPSPTSRLAHLALAFLSRPPRLCHESPRALLARRQRRR